MSFEDGYIKTEAEIRVKSSEIANKIIDKQLNELTRKINHEKSAPGESVAKKSLILMDTCAILDSPASQIFLQNQNAGSNIVIPLVVMGELQSLASKKDSRGVYQKAQTMRRVIMECRERGTLNIYDGNINGIIADEVFHSLIMNFAREYDITIVSQDYWLCQDLLTICRLPSVRGRKVKVMNLNIDGTLKSVEWRGTSYLMSVGE
ncbi:MAG: hypothetical protein IJS40_07975 [Synergistaceae bacterium]|nr:hypothetical protein [Synergistaceae bacterium]